MKKKQKPRRMTAAEMRGWIENTTTKLWGAATTLEIVARRMDIAVASIERTQPKREAQAVINGVLSDVRALVALMDPYYATKNDIELRFIVSRIAERLGEE